MTDGDFIPEEWGERLLSHYRDQGIPLEMIENMMALTDDTRHGLLGAVRRLGRGLRATPKGTAIVILSLTGAAAAEVALLGWAAWHAAHGGDR